jgi:hypothetical protein
MVGLSPSIRLISVRVSLAWIPALWPTVSASFSLVSPILFVETEELDYKKTEN